jgi:hypothetical protein
VFCSDTAARTYGFYFLPAYHHKTHQRIERQRHFNKHRARAICALTHASVCAARVARVIERLPAFETVASPASFAKVVKQAGIVPEA